ncbi:SRPBCC family protein [Lysobacter yangpyeongensis]|uniref:SRPBCC family protein n=1 Tax=Lysobacter yangpyeongensis TaxID=346182 RepID=A0ABW0SKB9_9GAMM
MSVAAPGRDSGFGTALKKRYVFAIGAVYGLLMRLAFGLPLFAAGGRSNAASEAMMWSFVCLVPFLIGSLTVHFSGGRRRTLGYALVAPWLPVLAFVGGTALLMIEGSICIAMALPLFLVVSSLGGVVMWAVLKLYRPSASAMSLLLVLPLLLGLWEREQPLQDRVQSTDASVQIDAAPEVIWKLINDAQAIRPSEMSQGLAYRIGVPYPESARTVATPQGRVRKLRWDKGVRFDEPIEAWQENRYIRWRYSFLPGAIPPEALDEHVVIGGKYFDLVDTSYRLTPVGSATRLDIRVTYRVSTNFNWYANAWGRLLVDDAARTILQFYKRRAEADGVARGQGIATVDL